MFFTYFKVSFFSPHSNFWNWESHQTGGKSSYCRRKLFFLLPISRLGALWMWDNSESLLEFSWTKLAAWMLTANLDQNWLTIRMLGEAVFIPSTQGWGWDTEVSCLSPLWEFISHLIARTGWSLLVSELYDRVPLSLPWGVFFVSSVAHKLMVHLRINQTCTSNETASP